MTAKEYLRQVKTLNTEINNMIEDLSMARTLATKITVSAGESEKVKTSGTDDRVSRLVSCMVDQERLINQKIDDYIDLKAKIKEEIKLLPKEVHRSILYERYILFKPYRSIARDLSYSEKYILNQHGRALMEFSKVMEQCDIDM